MSNDILVIPKSTDGSGVPSSPSFDPALSLELDRWQATGDELAQAFSHLRAAYRLCPESTHVPRSLGGCVWAFIEAVDAVRSLEREAGLR